jgi:hypothetical protein
MIPSQRLPGESLVQFYNRQLRERGRDDIEWIQIPGGGMRLREVSRRQQRMDLGQ